MKQFLTKDERETKIPQSGRSLESYTKKHIFIAKGIESTHKIG
jgi:hypothetical protein